MKTSTLPPSAPAWRIVDANGQSLGRMAAKIAAALRGKNSVTFSPHQLCGDHVVVVNAKDMHIPQKKRLQKMYHEHTGYFGHIRATSLGKRMEAEPERVVEDTVRRMLPKNRLRNDMMKRLHVFAHGEHPYAAQQPTPLSI